MMFQIREFEPVNQLFKGVEIWRAHRVKQYHQVDQVYGQETALPEQGRPQGFSLEIKVRKRRCRGNDGQQPQPEHAGEHVGNHVNGVGNKKDYGFIGEEVDGAHQDLNGFGLAKSIARLETK
jgi:hypothetical protein